MAQQDLVINNFQRGVASSPHTGFSVMSSIDVSSSPGVVQVQQKPTITASTVDGYFKWFTLGSGGNHALASSGKLYKWTNSVTNIWTTVTADADQWSIGQGCIGWKGYIFVARADKLDVWKDGGSWNNNFQSLTGSEWHTMFEGNDGKLYIGNGNKIARLEQKAGQTFDPGNAATYTWKADALDLPTNRRVKCLSELGGKLYIGTTDTTNASNATVYPWDFLSASYSYPIEVGTYGVHQMITKNNLLYIVTGRKHNVYVTAGGAVRLVGSLTDFIRYDTDVTGWYTFFEDAFPGAIAIYNEKILFGLRKGITSGKRYPLGVFSLDDKGSWACEYEDSTGTNSTEERYAISALGVHGTTPETVVFGGYYDNSYTSLKAQKVQLNYIQYLFDNYESYFETQLFIVGSANNPRIFKEVEITLVRPLATGEAVRIKYRQTLASSWTTMKDITFAIYGASTKIAIPETISVETLQIRCELKANASKLIGPELREIRLR